MGEISEVMVYVHVGVASWICGWVVGILDPLKWDVGAEDMSLDVGIVWLVAFGRVSGYLLILHPVYSITLRPCSDNTSSRIPRCVFCIGA